MINKAKFYDAIRPMFGGKLSASQVEGMNGLIAAFGAVGDGKPETLAYGLATAYHETGRRMVPVREGFATTDRGARTAVAKLAAKRGPNSAPAKYGKPQPPHGHVYYGRGHVQLTWIDNYRRSSADAGVDLVKDPDAMLDPVISARVLFCGLMDGRWNSKGKGLSAYLPADPVQARRTVNVLDKAKEIAGYYGKFLAAIEAAKEAPTEGPKTPAHPPASPNVNVIQILLASIALTAAGAWATIQGWFQ